MKYEVGDRFKTRDEKNNLISEGEWEIVDKFNSDSDSLDRHYRIQSDKGSTTILFEGEIDKVLVSLDNNPSVKIRAGFEAEALRPLEFVALVDGAHIPCPQGGFFYLDHLIKEPNSKRWRIKGKNSYNTIEAYFENLADVVKSIAARDPNNYGISYLLGKAEELTGETAWARIGPSLRSQEIKVVLR